MALPWETGGLMPWQIGQTFVDSKGVAWVVYPDPNSPSGYTLKRTDANGTSFQVGPSPTDPYAGTAAFENSPYGRRLTAAEAAAAKQNEFNQGITTRQVGVQEAQQQANAANQRALVQQAKDALAWQREQGRAQQALAERTQAQQFQLGQGNLGLNTLQLGSNLRGARDIFAYDRAAAGASSNPLLSSAVSTWADMTNNRPTGMGSWQGGNPERMTLGALANDFGGFGLGATPGSVSATNGGGKEQTLRALDEIARNPQQAHTNWWASLNPEQQQMAVGGWEELGHQPTVVLSRLNAGRVGQSTRGSRAA